MSTDIDRRFGYVDLFDKVALGEALFALQDFLGISLPELESAIKRYGIKRLLASRALALGQGAPSTDLARAGKIRT